MQAGRPARPDPPAKTRRDAIDRYRHRIQVALGLISSDGHLYVGESPSGVKGELVLTTEPYPVRLVDHVAERSLYLFVGQHFAVAEHRTGQYAGQWKVTTLAYAYSVGISAHPDDAWIHWHWHPSNRPDAHSHLVAAGDPIGTLREGIQGHHYPTGRVSVESVIRYLVTDCGIGARAGWDDVLAENEELFRRYRTWS